MTQKKNSLVFAASVILLTLSPALNVFAADRPAAPPSNPAAPPPPPAPPAPRAAPETLKPGVSDADEAGTLPERIDVQAMKRRYWTVGNEDLMDVVQNRLYKKSGRVELAARYGFWSDDPFVSSNTIGGSVGYHLNEFLSIHGNYSKVSWKESSAYKFARDRSFLPVINPTESVMGVEGRGSLVYGKLSFLGNAIIYYDFNFALGVSKLSNKAGDSPIGLTAGLGQQVYINRALFVTVDYRLMRHSDKFGNTTNTATFNTSRSVTTSWIQLGVGVFLF